MSTSAVQKSLLVQEDKTLKLGEKPVSKINSDQILIKVKAVTLNPTDWKHLSGDLKPGSSLGSDFAGDIVEIGSGAEGKGFTVGDAVAGFIRGGYYDSENGSFQEYVKTLPELVWHKPASLSYEDASAMGGIGLSTPVQGLFYRLGYAKPWDPNFEGAEPLLVYSAATSVGLFAVHLAHIAHIPVIATASPDNHDLVKSLGASAVFDYKDPELGTKINEWAIENGYKDGIKNAFDSISENGTVQNIAKCIGPKGGRTVVLLPPDDDAKEAAAKANLEIIHILIYSALKPDTKDFTDIHEWYSHAPQLIESGILRNTNPLTKATGLEGIPEALANLQAKKVRASKLAFTLS